MVAHRIFHLQNLCFRPKHATPQEVHKLCDELSSRRSASATAGTALGARGKPKPTANDDFWGAGAGASSSRATGSARGGGGGGGWGQEQERQTGKGKAKGKVYQKAAAEDFWGGGTTSGRSKPAKKSTPTPTAAAASAPARAPAPAQSRKNGPKASKNGGDGGGGGKLPATAKAKSTAAAAASPAQRPAASAAAAALKPNGKGGNTGGGKLHAAGLAGSAKSTRTPEPTPALAEPVLEWSGVTCQCMGKKHDIVTNCTFCGKIACVVEGGFGCSFCGSPLPVTGREPRKSGGGPGTATGESGVQSAALKEALARKDKLLLFDRTSASRTRVLDDQGDYFTSHNWLSQKEREKGEAEEKLRRDDAAERRGARRQVKLSIDIMGRRVIETQRPGDGGGEQTEAKETDAEAATEGLSLDFGSGREGAISGTEVAAPDDGSAQTSDRERGAGGDSQRPSLENTGLRGRAKEVYDVMRANLQKQGRRRPGEKAGKRGMGGGTAGQSRVSLWRVQHDVESDDIVRQTPLSGASSGGGGFGLDGIERFEPRDELQCN